MMPFAGGLAATANGTLLLSLVAAFLYLFMVAGAPSWRRTVAKTAAVALLAVLAAAEGGPWLLIVALALSAAGDAFLAQDGERPFLAGLASFLAAHLAYAALFLSAGSLALLFGTPLRLAAGALMVLFAVGMFRRLRPALPATMTMPVVAYVAAILAMGLSALGLPAPAVIAGAVLFMASDAILAVETFLLSRQSPELVWTRPAVWVLYYAAQVTITLGVLLA